MSRLQTIAEAVVKSGRSCPLCGYTPAGASFDALRAGVDLHSIADTLEKIQQWDMLNPPQPGTDFVWLKRLVDEALNE